MVVSHYQNNFIKSTEVERNALLFLILTAISIAFLSWLSLLSQFNKPNLSQEVSYWAGLTFSTPILYFACVPFFRSLLKSSFRFCIEIPIMLTLLLVYSYSLYSTITYTDMNAAYFDSILMILFIMYACRYLALLCKRRVNNLIEKHTRFPQQQAKLIRADNQFHPIDIKDITIGSKLFIAPGEHFPVDGIICDSDTSVDESMLTGEAHAIPKFANDTVRAGTCNLDNAVIIQATAVFSNSYLGKMLSCMQEVNPKANLHPPCDQIALWHQMIILTLVAAIFCWWLPLDQELAARCAISALLVTCPLSVAITFPLGIASILEIMAKRGIFIPNPLSFLKIDDVEYILFDKTGTLTEGTLAVQEVEYCNGAIPSEIMPLVATIEKNTNHPIANAIVNYANVHFSNFPDIEINRLRVFPGNGIRALVNGKFILVGSARWLRKNGIFVPSDIIESQDKPENRDHIFVHCAVGGIEVARIQLKDKLRQDATEVIQFLKSKRIEMSVLSGDRPVIVNAIAKQLGHIAAQAQALPQDKEAQVALLQDQGYLTAMVGDGLNDARALRRSDVGIALGTSDPITLLSADIILHDNGLKQIKDCFLFCHSARKILKQNYFLGFCLNLVMLPFAAIGQVTPMLSLLTICFSALIVMANTARLRLI